MKSLEEILEEFGLLEVRASWVNQRKGTLLNVIDNNIFMLLWSIIWMIALSVQALSMYNHWSTYVIGGVFALSTYIGNRYLKKTVDKLRSEWLIGFAIKDKDLYAIIMKKYEKEILNYLVNPK